MHSRNNLFNGGRQIQIMVSGVRGHGVNHHGIKLAQNIQHACKMRLPTLTKVLDVIGELITVIENRKGVHWTPAGTDSLELPDALPASAAIVLRSFGLLRNSLNPCFLSSTYSLTNSAWGRTESRSGDGCITCQHTCMGVTFRSKRRL